MKGSLGQYIASHRIRELEQRIVELERENENLRLTVGHRPYMNGVQVDMVKVREFVERRALELS